ncbi:MAG TPA: PepSY-associated TM helix domain-containing protein [Pseudomonadales bacterium]|nr:PepSY-associated TM helix domain-containing protein [Pseudomonadales bacterium]
MRLSKAALRRLHRYLGLCLAVLWLSQAATGLVMVFRWELDDATLAGAAAPLDPAALEARVAALEAAQPGHSVQQLYTSGSGAERFDLYLRSTDGDTDLVRVAGDGRVLRTQPYGRDFGEAGLIQAAAFLHQTLLAGDTGHWIVGVSGLFLLLSIGLGAVLAWPRRGTWRRTIWPRGLRPGAGRVYAWHRAAGLWLAAPAIVLVACGTLMVFEDPLRRALDLDAQPPELRQAPGPTRTPVGLAAALGAALGRFPDAALSGATMPAPGRPWYRVRVLQPGEWRRAYGTSVVYVSAADGTILLAEDALTAPAARRFVEGLYPVHTGEAGGLAGRLLTFAIGSWLLAMLGLGTTLWALRRRHG